MKTLRTITFSIVLLCASLGSALSAAPSVSQAQGQPAVAITLEQLKLRDLRLRGPSDALFFTFATPAHWALSAASMELDLTIVIPGDASAQAAVVTAPGAADNVTDTVAASAAGNCVAGTLNVSLNEQFLGAFPLLGGGERQLTVRVPAVALKTRPGAEGRHGVYIGFDNPDRCGVEQYAQVFVRPSSRFLFVKTDVEPPADLRTLPRPIAQSSYEPDTALLVLPDAPSTAELEAALNVAAGFGRMTGGTLGLTATAISKMTEAMWRDNHLIIVGKPGGLPIFGITKLPAPVQNGRFASIAEGDGVVQLATSPYNRTRSALIISGNDDAGVANAGKAVSSGAVRPTVSTALAVIDGANPPGDAPVNIPETRTLADLGYTTQRALSAGSNVFEYDFDAPNAIALIGDAYIDLNFVHSALLDYDRSSLSVFLNDVAVGSIRLSDNSTRVSRTRVLIPESALRPGNNRLKVQTLLAPRSSGRVLSADNLWLSVQADSALYMRFTSKPAPSVAARLNMANLPKPFSEEANLGSTAFVVAPQDPAGWATAVWIAYSLGQDSTKTALDLRAAFANDVPQPLRDARNLIVVGKASELPVLDALQAVLPAPFDKGSNIASERNAGVGYRVAEGDAIGYLQLVASPWNSQRAVLLALGSTDPALEWVAAAFVDSFLRERLSGNLAFINDEQIVSSNVRVAAAGAASAPAQAQQNPSSAAGASDLAAAATAVSATPASQGASQPIAGLDNSTRGLMFILFGLVGLAILIIVGSTAYNQWRRRSDNR